FAGGVDAAGDEDVALVRGHPVGGGDGISIHEHVAVAEAEIAEAIEAAEVEDAVERGEAAAGEAGGIEGKFAAVAAGARFGAEGSCERDAAVRGFDEDAAGIAAGGGRGGGDGGAFGEMDGAVIGDEVQRAA